MVDQRLHCSKNNRNITNGCTGAGIGSRVRYAQKRQLPPGDPGRYVARSTSLTKRQRIVAWVLGLILVAIAAGFWTEWRHVGGQTQCPHCAAVGRYKATVENGQQDLKCHQCENRSLRKSKTAASLPAIARIRFPDALKRDGENRLLQRRFAIHPEPAL